MCNNRNNPCCCLTTIISALISAAGIGILYYAGVLTSILPIIYSTLAAGIILILYLIFSYFCGSKCHKLDSTCSFPIILGDILVPIFLILSTPLAAGSKSLGIAYGALFFFFIMTLITIFNLIFNQKGEY